MVILKVEAFADYDVAHDVDLAIIENKEMADEVCVALNEFCQSLDGCDGADVKLAKYLSHQTWVDTLIQQLKEKTKIEMEKAKLLVDNIIGICRNYNVYIYSDIFSVRDVLNLN